MHLLRYNTVGLVSRQRNIVNEGTFVAYGPDCENLPEYCSSPSPLHGIPFVWQECRNTLAPFAFRTLQATPVAATGQIVLVQHSAEYHRVRLFYGAVHLVTAKSEQ